MSILFRLLLPAFFLLSAIPASASLKLIFPTRNHNLHEHPEQFYMQTARSGADAWMGGMYGFSRNARRVGGTMVNTRFHEGVDIAPLLRDGRGEPLDTVMAIDHGTVVYVNARAGASNYGKYIVVRHYWEGAPFFSLYAHLNETWVDSGQDIRQGTPIGRLGYTGAGINRARAHLHFEITMLVNENFQKWYDNEFGDNANVHGFYNGMNLSGLNVARLYERLQEEPTLTVRRFLETEHTPFYTVLLPREGRLDLLARYPWLLKKSAMPDDPTWEITFDASGLPLSVKPSKKEVSGPTLSWIADAPVPYTYLTKSYTRGSKGEAKLTGSGERFMRLVAIEQDSTAWHTKSARAVVAEEEEEEAAEEMAEEEMMDEEAVADDYSAGEEEATATEGVTGEKRRSDDGDVADASSLPEVEGIEETEEALSAGEEAESASPDEEEEEAANEGRNPEEGVAPGTLSPGRGEGASDEASASPYHTNGYFFNWLLNGKRWDIGMQPVVLSVPAKAGKRAGAGVDTVMARCDECARFGLGQPSMQRIAGDPTAWVMRMEVVDKGQLARRYRDANGKVFLIELYIRSGDEESVSTVKVRTAVTDELGG